MGNLETGFSGRNVPFFSLPSSKVFEHEPTVSEALELAELNFIVSKRPVYQKLNDGSFSQVAREFVSYRMDTEAPLGQVGNQWTPFQNEPALSLCDELLGHGARIAAAGSWNNGADVFVTAQLPDGISIPGEEALDLYLLFRNNHAGKGSVSAYITPVRIACTNMERLAVGSAVSSWKVRHTSTVSDRIHEATSALRLVDAYKAEFEDAAKALQETEITLNEFDALIKEVTESERTRVKMKETWNTSPSVGSGDTRTGWDAINVITETLQHNPVRNTGIESRFRNMLDGPIQRQTERATRLLLRR